jgi:hypothetical protein
MLHHMFYSSYVAGPHCSYKILSNILVLRLTPYVHEIILDHHCEFHHNGSGTHNIFYIHHILKNMGQYISYLQILRRACDSVRIEVLFSILTEFGIPVKLIRLIKM